MADLTVTAANVQQASGSTLVTKTAGAAVTAGEAVYIDNSGQVQPALHSGTALQASAVGIAVNGAPGAGQPVTYITEGNVDVGATLAVGTTYIVGAAAGGIAPDVDAGTGDYATVLGVATAANTLKMGVLVSGVTRP